MSKRYAMTLCGLLAVSLVACQPGTLLPGGLDGAPAAGAKQGLPITLRVALPGGMGVQALPKTVLDVAKLEVKLFKELNAGNPDPATDTPAGTANVTNPKASSVATINVTGDPGTYYVTVAAYDGASTPLLLNNEGSATISLNRVNIDANKVVTYTQVHGQAANELVVEISLIDGTPGTGTSTVTLSGGDTAAFSWASRTYGLALVNNASGRVSANPPNNTTSYQLTNVQDGLAVNPQQGFSHELWGFIAGPGGIATPASWLYGNGSAIGKINDPIDVGFKLRPLYTAYATDLSPSPTGYAMDGLSRLFHYNSTTGKFVLMGRAQGSTTLFAAPVETLVQAGVTGHVIDAGGAIFLSTGTGVQVATPAQSTSGYGPLQMLPGMSTVANIGTLAMDMRMNLYWYDTADQKIKKARWAGRQFLNGNYAVPEEVSGAIADFKGLKVSAYGHLYVADGSTISRRKLHEDGRTYEAPETLATADGLVTSMALDIAEHLYFTDANSHKVKMVGPAVPRVVYTVAGTGMPAPADTYPAGSDPTALGLSNPTGLAINQDSDVTFFSEGSGGKYFLRAIFMPTL